MLEVCLFYCSCFICSSTLVHADLKTLHVVKHILNEDECRSIGQAKNWWDDELAIAIVVKPPNVVQKALGVLKRDILYRLTAKRVNSKLCST